MMNQIYQSARMIGNIEYRLMEPKDYSQVVDVISSSFARIGPICTSLGLQKQDVSEHLSSIGEQFNQTQKLSLVAVDQSTNCVIGGILGSDYNKQHPTQNNTNTNDYTKFGEVLTRIRNNLIENKMIPSQEQLIYHVCYVGIHCDYEGKGVIKMLSQMSLELAYSLGFKQAISETSSAILQNIQYKQGYKPVYFYPYTNLKIDIPNRKVDVNKYSIHFKDGIEPGLRIMLKDLP